MKMSTPILFSFLLSFVITIDHVQSQDPSGFINLDCGRTGNDNYKDQATGLSYITDAAYIDTGNSRKTSPEYQTSSYSQLAWNLRSFPGRNGTRNCYTLRPENVGKGNKILLRVLFFYGNYDGENAAPQFDVHLGPDRWDTVTFTNSSSIFATEIFHEPTSDYVHVCLVNTGGGTPFISTLELRPINAPKPVYNTTFGSLKFFGRWDFGLTNTAYIRYPDDIYDRAWFPYNMDSSANIISSNQTNFIQNAYNLPSAIMKTAAQAPRTSDPLVITFNPNNLQDDFYFYFHIAELSANETREITIYINGDVYYRPFVPLYLTGLTVFSTTPVRRHPKYEITINTTENSKNPAIINAIEIYTVKQFLYSETDENDVAAMSSIKATYGIKRNWQGDPCLPMDFAWIGLSCSYFGFDPPKIVSLNLSSSGLNGTIHPSISNLRSIQSLDLSYNNLTGQVPDFVSRLPSLKYLNLTGNNFTKPLPPDLLKKSEDGSLILSFEGPSNYTKPLGGRNKKIKKFLVPLIIASAIAALSAFAILSVLIWRKQQAARVSKGLIVERKVTRSESNTKRTEIELKQKLDRSLVELKFRRINFSEVKSFIAEENIVGRGGNGTVYHGFMNGVEVALKVLKILPDQDFRDFQSEVNILATIHHKNLISLFGYWNEEANKGIIFELMENGNLEWHLSGKNPKQLSWEQRLRIMIGAAKGLEYLHHGCNPPIIHRDIKPANILLTNEFEAQLADFGLSRTFPTQSTRVAGTRGYLDPVYQYSGMMNEKSDVYSFGVLMLVVVTGRPAIVNGKTYITQWISPKIQQADIRGIVDPRIEIDFHIINAAWRVVELATACVCNDSTTRPTMSDVVKELTENLPSPVAGNERDAPANIGPSVFEPHSR